MPKSNPSQIYLPARLPWQEVMYPPLILTLFLWYSYINPIPLIDYPPYSSHMSMIRRDNNGQWNIHLPVVAAGPFWHIFFGKVPTARPTLWNYPTHPPYETTLSTHPVNLTNPPCQPTLYHTINPTSNTPSTLPTNPGISLSTVAPTNVYVVGFMQLVPPPMLN